MNATWARTSDGAGTWAHTRPRGNVRLTLRGTVLACLVLTLLLVGFIHLGRAAMCHFHKDSAGRGALSYCSDFKENPAR